LRVLYFYQYFTTPKGAWSTRAYEFARRWVECGDEVTVVTSVYDKSDLRPSGLVERFDVDGIEVIVLNIRLSNKHGIAQRLYTFAMYALLASWYAIRVSADVVVASSGPITVGIPGVIARYVRRRPFVFEVRDLWPEGAIQLDILRGQVPIRLARWFERLCYRTASSVVALSKGQADWIRRDHALDELHIVPNASDNALVEAVGRLEQRPDWAEGRHLVLYTGTLGLIDDCAQILDIAHLLQERGRDDVQFVIIGDGKERAPLEQRAAREVLDHVHFLGLKPKEDVMRWLQEATCALFVVKDVPFLATASPNKLFDAFAAGVPVVQATQGWIKDLLDRERCGLTVPQSDPAAMAEAVLRLVDDPDLRESMGANARRVAREEFDRDLLAEKMHGILQRAVRRDGAST
jgi:glycosyltransferase involved in cell wall biosynthesis